MKMIYLTQQLSSGTKVLNGGELASKSNYDAFVNILGIDNVIIINIPHKTKTYRRYIDYLMLRNMYSKKDEKNIIEQINAIEWDILFFDGSWFGRISSHIKKKGKIITFLHNVEYQYSMDRLKKNPLTLMKFISVSYNEKWLLKKSDYIIVLNKRDEHFLKKFYERKADLLLPITLHDVYRGNSLSINTSDNRKVLLFVGSYFTPNVAGIKWFIKKVMPEVDCSLLIVGKGMERLKKFETQNITILGTVEDLGGLYQKADAIVMPIFSGGGMKVKTAEALMWGKVLLASKEALTGYDVEQIDCIKECNTKEDFINGICKLQDNEKYKPEVRELFLNRYEQSIKISQLADFIYKVT